MSDHIGQLVKFHTEGKCYETMLSYGVIVIVYTSSWLSGFFFDCLAYKTVLGLHGEIVVAAGLHSCLL